MSVSEEVAALRADPETMKREKEATQAELDRVQLEKEASDAENGEHGMRFRRERSLGTSFGERGGGGSADRRGTAASPMGPMWTRGARQQPSRGTPSIGVRGIYDCGSNAVYDQEDSPPPPGAPMCAVYRCGRCGRHGHKSEHCAAPRRFEGTCGACSQYGHMWRDCALSSR